MSDLTDITIPEGVTRIGMGAFRDCTSLTSASIPEGVTCIDGYLFDSCESLTDVTIPDSVTTIGWDAFQYCTGLTSITIPDSVTGIGQCAFLGCSNLTSATIWGDITTIPIQMFYQCSSLTSVFIPASVTRIQASAFSGCTDLKDVYYGGTEEQWRVITKEEYNTDLTSAAIHYNSTPADMPTAAAAPADTEEIITTETASASVPSVYSIWGGEYGTEVTDTVTLKTASFSGLVPGGQYVLLAMVSLDAEDLLAPSNLLCVQQAAAAEDGTLVFRYIQRENTEVSYVAASGPSNKNLKDAQITFPEMYESETVDAVDPTVVYDGKTLVEGLDYVILGTVDYTAAGEYACYIRGIYDYAGLVACTYIV